MPESAEWEEVYAGALVSVRARTVTEPGGGSRRYEVVEHPDAVAIVALREDPAYPAGEQQVALVRQMRPAIGRETWELPAGLVAPEERGNPQQAAARELREETGYEAAVWRGLAREYSSPGFSTEAITIYLARQLTPLADGAIDPVIERVRWAPLSEALASVASGEIEDGKTLLGLALAARHEDVAPTVSGNESHPMDPTNPPFNRPQPTTTDSGAGESLDGQLHIENLLLSEYNYASVIAYQSMEDRARMFNFFLIIIGVLVSGIGALYQINGGSLNNAALAPLLTLILIGSGILSLAFFLKLLFLRSAYREALIAMNVIKEYYILQFKQTIPHIERAFRWRLLSIPSGERVRSVGFVLNSTVALIGAAAFGLAAKVSAILWQPLLGVSLDHVVVNALALVVALIALAVMLLIYRVLLNKHAERSVLNGLEAQLKQAAASA